MLGSYENFKQNALATQEAARKKHCPLIIWKEDIEYAKTGDFTGVLIPFLPKDTHPEGYLLEQMFSVSGASYLAVIEQLVKEDRFIAGKAYAIIAGGKGDNNFVAQFKPEVYKTEN
jgi:hypothetical protein